MCGIAGILEPETFATQGERQMSTMLRALQIAASGAMATHPAGRIEVPFFVHYSCTLVFLVKV